MKKQEEDEERLYSIVVNNKEQYSIWPADRENPIGWRKIGVNGPKKQCLEFIQEVWMDMLPLSNRARSKSKQKEVEKL